MHYMIVRRGDFQMYDLLYKTFSARVPVIWDRRQRTAPPDEFAPGDNERRTDKPPASWIALGFVVVDRDLP
jgi:hypothetical protein